MPDAVPFYDLFADQEVVCNATRKPFGDEAVIEFFYKMGYDYSCTPTICRPSCMPAEIWKRSWMT
jgi:hypothetical protein